MLSFFFQMFDDRIFNVKEGDISHEIQSENVSLLPTDLQFQNGISGEKRNWKLKTDTSFSDKRRKG